MSSPFQERFKNRTSHMPSGGISKILLEPLQAKPEVSKQVTLEPVNKSERSPKLKKDMIYLLKHEDSDLKYHKNSKIMIKSDRSIREGQILSNKSASPDVKLSNFLDNSYEKLNKSTTRIEYKPYSMKDYKNIKIEKYLELGGLGPTSVGSDEWVKKKELYDKRLNYSKEANFRNAANMHLVPFSTKLNSDSSARKRAIEFAKSIIRPPLRIELANKY